MRGLGLLALRVSVGVVYMAHGLQKLFPICDGSPQLTAVALETAGVSSAYLVTVGSGLAEVIGGGLLIFGAYTTWTALLVGTTTVAIGMLLYYPNGFFLNWSLASGVAHGAEFDVLRLGALVCLMFAGPGALSFDARRASERENRKSQKLQGRKQKAARRG